MLVHGDPATHAVPDEHDRLALLERLLRTTESHPGPR